MSWGAALLLALQMAWALVQYLTGKDAMKRAAALAMAEQFAKLEKQGITVLPEILERMGRSSWVDWDSIPVKKDL